MIETNSPSLWLQHFPWPEVDAHKYQRGSVLVAGGGVSSSGAARLAARGALRAGAGVVTVACPASAMMVYAGHLTAVMVRAWKEESDIDALVSDAKYHGFILGPGQGVSEETTHWVVQALASEKPAVLDADALTVFEGEAEALAKLIKAPCILTPHEGEFKRLFGAIENRERAVMQAAKQSGAVVILKGAKTLIASPDGRCCENRHATAFLATAGSGDVLAGIAGALLTTGMPAFEAACAAVWLHGEAGCQCGPGLIAEDLPEALPTVFGALYS